MKAKIDNLGDAPIRVIVDHDTVNDTVLEGRDRRVRQRARRRHRVARAW
ncbi:MULTISPECIES: hypothetical protein [unclassified Caballeronia]|nr:MULTISPECIES: hypothetical protein [unclassified Caballeronia]MCE4545106.1 hypothetical protein [Caballeronia sp. PC1]MCE4570531.1 hypothetical protein [Caballeronia sp. CLC5]